MTFDRTQKPEMIRNQPGNYLSHNAAVQALEDSVNKHTTHALSDADYTLTTAQFGEFGFIEFTGALTAARKITIPAFGSNQHIRAVYRNGTSGGFDLTVGYSTGATVTIAHGQQCEIQGDGTDVIRGGDPNVMDLPSVTVNETEDWFSFYDSSSGQLARVLGENLPSSGGGGGGGVGPADLILHVQDQKAEDTNGQSLTDDVWNTRDINTVLTNQIVGASLAANRITLAAGTYFISAIIDAHVGHRHISRLENITDATEVLLSVNTFAVTESSTTFLRGRFTISAEKDFEIQTLVAGSTAALGGFAIGSGTPTAISHETYLDAVIVQLDGVPGVQTTNATQTTLLNEALAAYTGILIEATVQGREAATGAVFGQTLTALVRNEAGTGSISTVQKSTAVSIGTVTGWAVDMDIDTVPALDEWRLRVTGAAAMTIDWTASIKRIVQAD